MAAFAFQITDPLKRFAEVNAPHVQRASSHPLPLTAALASERGFIDDGHRVGFFGIGSGLNCMMLGVEW